MIYNEYITDEDNWKEENIDEKSLPCVSKVIKFSVSLRGA